MKKLLKIMIFIFFVMITTFVKAEELPRDGVTYFLTYPDGSEIATENYDEAIEPQEMMLYEGYTNENGEVRLDGWTKNGELRIVQVTPDGYTAFENEGIVDLSGEESFTFINYKSVVNPKTGRGVLLILLGGLSLILIILTIKKNKKVLLTICIAIMIIISYKVGAINRYFVVIVKDEFGNKLSGVQIKVYAKPYKVEGKEAIKISANGGHFFDNKEVMYIRIPNDGCSLDDLFGSLDDEYLDYFDDNCMLAYRDGYTYSDIDFSNSGSLHNGDTFSLVWEENDGAKTFTIHGNGGWLNFYGIKLKDIHIYNFDVFYRFLNNGLFINSNDTLSPIGLDDNSACRNFANGGNGFDVSNNVRNDYYMCWAPIKKFKINETTFYYIDGMTWRDWLDSFYGRGFALKYSSKSDYNFLHAGESIFWCGSSNYAYNYEILFENGQFVLLDDIIDGNNNYTLEWKNIYYNGTAGGYNPISDGEMEC